MTETARFIVSLFYKDIRLDIHLTLCRKIASTLLVGWMIPVVIVGSFLGYLLHKRIPAGLFEKIILGFVLIVSIRLIFFT